MGQTAHIRDSIGQRKDEKAQREAKSLHRLTWKKKKDQVWTNKQVWLHALKSCFHQHDFWFYFVQKSWFQSVATDVHTFLKYVNVIFSQCTVIHSSDFKWHTLTHSPQMELQWQRIPSLNCINFSFKIATHTFDWESYSVYVILIGHTLFECEVPKLVWLATCWFFSPS